jgi:hypothetical protein
LKDSSQVFQSTSGAPGLFVARSRAVGPRRVSKGSVRSGVNVAVLFDVDAPVKRLVELASELRTGGAVGVMGVLEEAE